MLDAFVLLGAALRKVLDAWGKLAISEGRLTLACIPLWIATGVALATFCLSLWLVLVALVGWFLIQATHSPGIALGILAAIHIVLALGTWICLKRWLRQASFPRTRAELGALRSTLQRTLARPPAAGRPDSVAWRSAAHPPRQGEQA